MELEEAAFLTAARDRIARLFKFVRALYEKKQSRIASACRSAMAAKPSIISQTMNPSTCCVTP
jgi:hypothetical protein